ncbi:hypothetical protein F2Q68_00014418 [Brassica cretica]|uniref:Uncharacterized protein n=2 Tax=Brassica cretica TaxID=69181 RepID=A0ABQ7F3T6_BRACR|nr:hypothetical protein F2Q68_00014418 [Brassica cretica]KAF3609694.1 hypothetical protein DY000_02046912 [Brassica cretica]
MLLQWPVTLLSREPGAAMQRILKARLQRDMFSLLICLPTLSHIRLNIYYYYSAPSLHSRYAIGNALTCTGGHYYHIQIRLASASSSSGGISASASTAPSSSVINAQSKLQHPVDFAPKTMLLSLNACAFMILSIRIHRLPDSTGDCVADELRVLLDQILKPPLLKVLQLVLLEVEDHLRTPTKILPRGVSRHGERPTSLRLPHVQHHRCAWWLQ